MAAVPWFHAFRAEFVAGALTAGGVAAALRTANVWWYRVPITFRGRIDHSERPVAYHLVSLSGFIFSSLLTFAGLSKLFTGWTPWP